MLLFFKMVPYVSRDVRKTKKIPMMSSVMKGKVYKMLSSSTRFMRLTARNTRHIKITPLNELYKIHLAKIMYQHKNKLLPRPLQALYTPNTDTHQHNTRHRNDPHITRNRTHTVNKTFIHKAPAFWYTLPDSIKEARTINIFKNRVTRLLGY